MSNANNVVKFPLRKGERGVFCPPLKLYFPPIYRCTQTVTPEAAKQYESLGVEAGVYVSYVLDARPVVKPAVVEQIKCLPTDAKKSLLLRRHNTVGEASLYLAGAYDAVATSEHDDGNEPIRYTEHGVFTMIEVATKEEWHSPMIAHLTEYPTNSIFGYDYWEFGIDSDGNSHILGGGEPSQPTLGPGNGP